MAPYYPVYLDIRDRRCVIVGGGQMAEGKVAALRESGAQVCIISPEVTGEIQGMADSGMISLEKREYRDGDLEGAFIAIAATDDSDLDERISREAAARNVPLNVVDVTHLCTFIAPAVIRRGEVTVAISTAGLSPALARKLRVELQDSPALDYADMALMLSEVRLELRSEGAAIDADHWQTCLNRELVTLFYADREAAKQSLKRALLDGAATGVSAAQ